MLEFLQVPFLVLHFSCYTLMTILTMLSLILVSMLMILLSILTVIRHLIGGNNLNWLLNSNLIYERLWAELRSGLLISMLGKLSWFPLTSVITMFYGCKNGWVCGWGKSSFKMLGLTLSSKFDWGSYIISIAKTPSRFLLWLLCISINLPHAHVWNTVARSGLVPLVATWNC